MSMRGFLLFSFLAALAAFSAAAGDDALSRGRRIYADTQDFEYPSCAHCHATVAPEQAQRLAQRGPGGTLYGSARREGWRNRKSYKEIGTALQYCAKTWQRRKKGIRGDDLKALVAYLETLGPGEGKLPARKVKRPKALKDYEGGDAAKGKPLVVWCSGCHGDADDSLSFELIPGKKRKDVLARKLRGYDTKRRFKPEQGTMSYYTQDRLSDEEARDIIAYLGR